MSIESQYDREENYIIDSMNSGAIRRSQRRTSSAPTVVQWSMTSPLSGVSQ